MTGYFRFPETGAMQERFWGLRPRNPCGNCVSLERGTKTFAWANMIYGSLCSILSVICLLLPLFDHTNTAHHEMLTALKAKGKLELSIKEDAGISFKKVYGNHSHALLQTLFFITFIIWTCLWYYSWRLKKSVIEKDVPKLKRYYAYMLLIIVLISVLQFWETEMMWSRAFFIDIPMLIVEILGLICTHAYIASLISPGGGLHDDMNRIQFNA